MNPGVVVVWWMVVASPPSARLAHWRARLDHDERAHADRFHFAADRETSIAAHALKRALLARVGGLPPAAWRFVAGSYGKPEIDPAMDRPRLRFNLSHTRGLVACAVGLDYGLGLDVEDSRGLRETMGAAARFLAPAELALLRQARFARQRDTFARIWTLKEAYIKATGLGLACPLDCFAVRLHPIGVRFRDDVADDPRHWRFAQWRPTSDCVAAIAQRSLPMTPLTVIGRAVQPTTL